MILPRGAASKPAAALEAGKSVSFVSKRGRLSFGIASGGDPEAARLLGTRTCVACVTAQGAPAASKMAMLGGVGRPAAGPHNYKPLYLAELLASAVCLLQYCLRGHAFSMPCSRERARRWSRKKFGHDEDMGGSCMEIEPSPILTASIYDIIIKH